MSFASLSTHKRPLRKQSINLHAAIKYNKKKNGEQKIIRNGLERERNEQILNTKSNFNENYGRFQVVYFIIYRCIRKRFFNL